MLAIHCKVRMIVGVTGAVSATNRILEKRIILMKKAILILIVLGLAGMTLPGCGGGGRGTGRVFSSDPNEALVQRMLATMEDLNAELATVTDGPSAAAAAPRIETLVTRMSELGEELDQMDEETSDALEEAYADRIDAVAEVFGEHLERIMSDPAMAEPLTEAFAPMFNVTPEPVDYTPESSFPGPDMPEGDMPEGGDTVSTPTDNEPTSPAVDAGDSPFALAPGDLTLETGEFYDEHPFQADAGQAITAEMTSSEFDTYLIVVSPSGEVWENDDFGSTSVSHLELIADASGTWLLVATSYQAGETGNYAVDLDVSDAAPTLTPDTSGNNSSATDTPATSGEGEVSVSGELASGDSTLTDGEFFDAYTFNAQAGQSMAVEMTSSEFDTYLIVVSPSNEVWENDDYGSTSVSHVEFTADASGEWRVMATSYSGGETGDYAITVWLDGEVVTRLTPAASSPMPAGISPAEARSLVVEMIDTLEDLTSTLAMVTDGQSATQAAPRVETLVASMNSMAARLDTIDAATSNALEAEFAAQVDAIGSEFEAQMMRISQDPELLGPLQQAFSQME